ncbi:hypothetical protein [Methylobacterium indicum]|uniref:Uncharacterized protein n=1 Tax=Methylobacterium indicum TaxID=1775910 RepID=A0A8H8WWM9_9HYPH|nr:hypothetical protein [Methylobacterium indicum]BCM85930.1 hypothetical protein mvi_43910 [Methylobacterium indicum]
MAGSGRPSLLSHTWAMAFLVVLVSLAVLRVLAPPGPEPAALAGKTIALRGLVEPETTGSIAGEAARTRLDPCTAGPRP